MKYVWKRNKKSSAHLLMYLLFLSIITASCSQRHEADNHFEEVTTTATVPYQNQASNTPAQTNTVDTITTEPVFSLPTSKLALVKLIDEIPFVCIVNADGTDLQCLTDKFENGDFPFGSPNNNIIGFVSMASSPFRPYLIVMDIESSQILFQIEDIKESVLSPDGSQLAYTTSTDYISSLSGEIWLASDPDWASRQLFTTSENVGAMFWSPTSNQILVRIHDPESGAPKLMLLNLDGSTEEIPIVGSSIDWDPTGHMIVYSDFDGLKSQVRIFDIVSKEDHSVTERGEYSGIDLSWSPLGNLLALRVHEMNSDDSNFHLMDLKAESTTSISTNGKRVYGFSWSPDGLYLGLMMNKGDGLICSLHIYSLQEGTMIETTESEFDCRQIVWKP